MRFFSTSSPLLRRLGAGALVAAVAIALVPPDASAMMDSRSKAKAVINTYKSYDGTESMGPFGCGHGTAYGQTIRIRAGRTKLTGVNFYLIGRARASQSMVMRGELYKWNAAEGRATGRAVGESSPQTIAFGDDSVHKVTFRLDGKVWPGYQYIIFASIDKDYESCTGGYEVAWGSVDGRAYRHGNFVFLNNGGDEDYWTTRTWGLLGSDTATKVFMK